MTDPRSTEKTVSTRILSLYAAWTLCICLTVVCLTRYSSTGTQEKCIVAAPLGQAGAVSSSEPSGAAFSQPLPLSRPAQYAGRYFSQARQDEAVDKILEGMTGGFFVESGAYDGVNLSNSLLFEASRGWRGLLVEANPYLYQDIVHRSGRNASVIHACVSPTTRPEVLQFRLAGALGGIVDTLPERHVNRIKNEVNKTPWTMGVASSAADIKVPCWPLAAMLTAMQVKRVDFWSLDTEGSEAAILAATDFDSIDIRVILVEVNDAAAEANVKAVMSRRPEFKLHSKLDWDLIYVKRGNFPPS